MAEEKNEKVTEKVVEKVEYEKIGFEGDYVIYKDKPLVRNGNFIRYGDMSDKYILEIIIMNTKSVTVNVTDGDKTKTVTEEVPAFCIVRVLSTDTSKSEAERLVLQDQANGLYSALDLGIHWMNSENGK